MTSDLKALSQAVGLVVFVLLFSVSQILQEFFKGHAKERLLEMRPSRRGMFSFVPCFSVMAWTACGWESSNFREDSVGRQCSYVRSGGKETIVQANRIGRKCIQFIGHKAGFLGQKIGVIRPEMSSFPLAECGLGPGALGSGQWPHPDRSAPQVADLEVQSPGISPQMESPRRDRSWISKQESGSIASAEPLKEREAFCI